MKETNYIFSRRSRKQNQIIEIYEEIIKIKAEVKQKNSKIDKLINKYSISPVKVSINMQTNDMVTGKKEREKHEYLTT